MGIFHVHALLGWMIFIIIMVTFNCALKSAPQSAEEIINSIHNSITSDLFDDFVNRTVTPDPTWVHHADSPSRLLFTTARSRYTDRLMQLGIPVRHNINISNNNSINIDSIFALSSLSNSVALKLVQQALDMFNAFDNYESGIVALAALAALSSPLPSFTCVAHDTGNCTGSVLSASMIEGISTCLWILSQTEWERGYVDRARMHMDTMLSILHAQGMGKETVASATGITDSTGTTVVASGETAMYVLFQLRRILSVPRMPVDSSAAIQHRQTVMYPALRAWIAEFRGVEIPVEYLSLGAATAFYLSHQGINERQVQELLVEGFSTLCPALRYVSPLLSTPVSWEPRLSGESVSVPSGGTKPAVARVTKCLRVGLLSAWFYEQSIGKLLYETVREMALLQYGIIDPGDGGDAVGGNGNIDYTIELVLYFLDQRVDLGVDADGKRRKYRDRYTHAYRKLFVSPSADAGFEFGPGDPLPRQGVCASKPLIGERFVHIVNTEGGPLDSRFVKPIQELVGSHQLDVLIFADVGMDFLSYLLSFGRMAAVQAVWWGHPITSGNSGEAIDYYLSLDVELSDAAEEAYSEQLIRMDRINTLRSPPPLFPRITATATAAGSLSLSSSGKTNSSNNSDDYSSTVRGAGSEINVFSTIMDIASNVISGNTVSAHGRSGRDSISDHVGIGMGIDDLARVKYCLVIGATYKLHPIFLSTVADLLVQAETAVDESGIPAGVIFVVFIAERGSVEFNEDVILQIRAALHSRLLRREPSLVGSSSSKNSSDGVEVAAAVLRLLARVQFHSYDSYFPLLASAAIVLDTFPYGGCLTTHDALSHGVPIVTYPQHYIRGRFSLALYEQMGVSEYIVASAAEYVTVVLRVLRRDEAEAVAARVRLLDAFHLGPEVEKQAGSGQLHQNKRVAKEWLGFLIKAWRYQYEV